MEKIKAFNLLFFSLIILSGVYFFRSDLLIDNSLPYESIEYEIETNFTVRNFSNYTSSCRVKLINLENRYSNQTKDDLCELYQEVETEEIIIDGENWALSKDYDYYENEYDVIQSDIVGYSTLTFSRYNSIKVNSISLKGNSVNSINYSMIPDNVYNLYGRLSFYDLEEDNYPLVSLSNTITKDIENPYEKVRAIYRWIVENIEYDYSYSNYDALETYMNRKGICFSQTKLMISLLKFQHIPARFVFGITFPKNLKKGDDFLYSMSYHNGDYEDNGFSTHAWLEFYIPTLGWIYCDPTHEQFNRMDCHRIIFNVGYESIGIYPRYYYYYPKTYPNASSIPKDYHFALDYVIKIQDITFEQEDGILSLLPFLIFGVCFILSIFSVYLDKILDVIINNPEIAKYYRFVKSSIRSKIRKILELLGIDLEHSYMPQRFNAEDLTYPKIKSYFPRVFALSIEYMGKEENIMYYYIKFSDKKGLALVDFLTTSTNYQSIVRAVNMVIRDCPNNIKLIKH